MRDRQPGLALADVGRDRERRGTPGGSRGTGAATGWSRTNARTASVRPGQRPQLGVVVRVLHEPDVEDEVRLERDAELEPEADELERELVRPDVGRQGGEQPLAELAQRQVRRVEDDVRLGPDRHRAGGAPRRSSWRSRAPRRADGDGASRCSAGSGRRRSPRGRRPAAGSRGPRARRASPPRASVASPARTSSTIATRANRCAVRRDELGQVGQQLAGQVVDDGVAEVLEQLRGGGLAATGQAADDDDGGLGHRVATAGSDLGRRRSPPAAPDEQERQLEQDVHRAAEDDRADQVAAGRRDRGEDRDAEDDHPARGASAAAR